MSTHGTATVIVGVGRNRPNRDISHAELSLERIRKPIADAIEDKIREHPRSLQTRIGPSELGVECVRRLGLKLAGTHEKARDAAWRPTVGTAVHTWLDTLFTERREAGETRWHPERKVEVGLINGTPITGSCDLFDAETGTVFDWKVVGLSTLKSVKAHGASEQYRVQSHLYGRGYARAGFTVQRVCIVFLPASGELDDAVWWSEAWDEEVAIHALKRASAIVRGLERLGPDVLIPQLNRVESYCKSCPFYAPKSTSWQTCPGAQSLIDEAERPKTQRDVLGR